MNLKFSDVHEIPKNNEFAESPLGKQLEMKNKVEVKDADMPFKPVDEEKQSKIYDGSRLDGYLGIKNFIPRTGGKWEGEEGNSKWCPDKDTVPGDRNGTNPEHKTWGDILEKYDIDGIPFKDGEPDFSAVERGTVEIDDFTDDRSSNFDQADQKMAEQRGCTPEEVAAWRKEHGYTWHECKDCKTMQKVPTEVHGNVPHSGGVSEHKSRQENIQ